MHAKNVQRHSRSDDTPMRLRVRAQARARRVYACMLGPGSGARSWHAGTRTDS